jgi:hypothetical protein
MAVPSSGLAQGQPSFQTGKYKGKTSQGLPISFTVSSTAVASINFRWRARCADGRKHSNTIIAGGGPLHNGRFSLGGTLNTGGTAHVAGQLKGSTASGTLSRSGPSAFGTNCLAAGVKWHAHASTKTFTGTTSQGLPISFTATPTAILSLNFDWTANCADGQTHTNTISAGGGPISQGSFSLGGILNTGGSFQVDGTVNGSTASGTLSRSGPSAFGTFDCTATGVTWQANAP